MAITYKDAGVDVERGYEAVKRIKEHAKKTFNPHVLTGLGSFGAMYEMGDTVLVSGTDGVGTKLKAAFALDKHDTVGIDCVAMCVNDVLCHGAATMFFLDYIATGALKPAVVEQIVSGVAEGCSQSACALIGGETAEMPGFYPTGEYDLAGFCVGQVKKDKIINGSTIQAGDALIGLGSTGVHSNGFSLVRRLFPMTGEALMKTVYGLDETLGEALLKPTRIYVKPVLKLIDNLEVHGIAHITGGGFIENIPRMLPEECNANIKLGSWEMPQIFDIILHESGLNDAQAYNTFNMGIGMVISVAGEDADAAISLLKDAGERAYLIGEVKPGERGVTLCR